jgi:PAS domain S-box-containing protein
LQTDLRWLATLHGELEEREAKIRRLVDANIIGVLISDFEGRIIEANDAFLDMVGFTRDDVALGRLRWTEMTPAEWQGASERAVAQVRATGACEVFEKEHFRKDGSRVPVLVGAAAVGGTRSETVAFVLDLTERKRAETEARESERRYREALMELAHANRVATMGQLAASIAHEVNQPIAAAFTNAAALRWLGTQPPDLEEVRQALGRIGKDTNRAGDVIGRVRDLIKKAPPPKDSLDINKTIRDVIVLTCGEAVKNGVSAQTQFAEGLPLIQGDRIQLQQVILNLIINAIEAMSRVGEGSRRLLISTEKDGQDGVLAAVQDSGPGLTPANHEQLFEAFYTTKPSGFGDGAVDLSFDHRSSWRTIVGDRKRAPRRRLSIHGAYPPRQCIVIGRPALREDQPGARKGASCPITSPRASVSISKSCLLS